MNVQLENKILEEARMSDLVTEAESEKNISKDEITRLKQIEAEFDQKDLSLKQARVKIDELNEIINTKNEICKNLKESLNAKEKEISDLVNLKEERLINSHRI